MKQRLDLALTLANQATTRSQAENLIRLAKVSVNGRVVTKAGHMVGPQDRITLDIQERYVSRAGLKLASVAKHFSLDFTDKVVLDIGSSTGGFTDYALQNGARKVLAVDVGTDQLHPSLRSHPAIELHEKTDIRNFYTQEAIDIIVGDVSFISLREILPHVAEQLMGPHTQLVAMVKPQFEARRQQINKGVIKNNTVRREILSSFEQWAKQLFVIVSKRDSDVAGAKGNLERFYVLRLRQNAHSTRH